MNNIVVYILVVVSLALGSWSLKAQVESATMMARMDERMIRMEQETGEDEMQNNQLSKQWKYLGQLKEKVMILEMKNGINPTPINLGD